MTTSFYNRVMFTANFGGTADFTVGAAVTGYSTPATRSVPNGVTVSYVAESTDKTQWETGSGIYTSASQTIARTTIRESSSAGAKVDFSAAPSVWFDFHAQDVPVVFTSTVPGLVPASGGGTTTYLRADGGFEVPPNSVGVDWVNITDFGASTASSDNTAAIQAAIDYAYANGIVTVYVPSGNWRCDDQIFLDPPGNLRSSFSTPTIFAFSMALIGDPGLPNHEGDGSILRFNRNDDVMLVVGTGQGMMVRDLNVFGPTSLTRGQQDPDGVGIGLCGGNGGSTRTRIENVCVEYFYTAIKTSANNANALCDSNTFIKCYMSQCYYGFYFGQTQNFINSLYDCQPGCTVNIWNGLGVDIKVIGGNYSSTGVVGSYAIGSTSALTAASTGNSYNYTFTTTITSPDTNWEGGGAFAQIFNSVAFETEDFGIVPGVITGYVAATNVCTIQIYPMWGYTHFGGTNAKTDTDLQANLQNCTTAFFGERVTTFLGNNITVDMVHVENPDTPTTLVDAIVGFGSNRPVTLKNVFMNFDPTNVAVADHGTPSIRARYMLAAHHFPFFTNASSGSESTSADIHLMDVTLTGSFMPILVDIVGDSSFKVDGARGSYFTLRCGSNGRKIAAFASEANYWTSGSFVDEGHCKGYCAADTFRSSRVGFAPFWGWRPAPYTTPCVKAGDRDILSGTLPSILSSTGSCSYPILWGGQMYRENDISGTDPLQFWSDHTFYSYGQNLTTTNCPGLSWTYKGQSHVVYCNDMNFIFPGLGVILNDGSNDIEYVVTGVYGFEGYFTVARNGGSGLLSGTKTVDYAGTTIKQAPYDIQTGLIIATGDSVGWGQYCRITGKTTGTNLVNGSVNIGTPTGPFGIGSTLFPEYGVLQVDTGAGTDNINFLTNAHNNMAVWFRTSTTGHATDSGLKFTAVAPDTNVFFWDFVAAHEESAGVFSWNGIGLFRYDVDGTPTYGSLPSRFRISVNSGKEGSDTRMDLRADGTNMFSSQINTGAAQNTVTDVMVLRKSTDTTPVAGTGSGLRFDVRTAAGFDDAVGIKSVARIDAVTTDLTGGSEDADLVFKTMAAGATAAERLRIKSTGAIAVAEPVSIPAGGTAGLGVTMSATANFGVFFGSGAPTLSAAKGSLYLRSDGSGTSDRMYVNTNGSTTWTAVTTAA